MIAIIMMIDDRFRSISCDHQSSNDHRNLVNLPYVCCLCPISCQLSIVTLPYRSEARRQTKRKRYSAVGETEVDQEELLQSAKKRSREDVDDEVGGWRDVDDELDGWRDDLDKSF